MKPKCGVRNCDKEHLAKGFCRGHYEREFRNKNRLSKKPLTDKKQREVPPCGVAGCEEKHMARGFCRKHYFYMRFSEVGNDDNRCKIDKCVFRSIAKGYCPAHYQAVWQINNSVAMVENLKTEVEEGL